MFIRFDDAIGFAGHTFAAPCPSDSPDLTQTRPCHSKQSKINSCQGSKNKDQERLGIYQRFPARLVPESNIRTWLTEQRNPRQRQRPYRLFDGGPLLAIGENLSQYCQREIVIEGGRTIPKARGFRCSTPTRPADRVGLLRKARTIGHLGTAPWVIDS
jgi:hypothetical protein